MGNNKAALTWRVDKAAKKKIVKLNVVTSPLEAELAAISAVVKHEEETVDGGQSVVFSQTRCR